MLCGAESTTLLIPVCARLINGGIYNGGGINYVESAIAGEVSAMATKIGLYIPGMYHIKLNFKHHFINHLEMAILVYRIEFCASARRCDSRIRDPSDVTQ